jgi:hypothetical protein
MRGYDYKSGSVSMGMSMSVNMEDVFLCDRLVPR